MPRALALALVVVLAAGACGSRALAGCGPIGAAQPYPRGEPLRVIHLDQTWRSPTGYAKFTPAPPANAALTISAERAYEWSGQPWEATLTLP